MEDEMKLAALTLCAALAAVPAMAQQQGKNSVLDSLEGALNQLNQRGGQHSGTDNQQLDTRNLPRDQSGRVDVRRLSDDQLQQYDEALTRQGRSIARDLRDTEREMQARNLDQSGYSGSSRNSRGGSYDNGDRYGSGSR
jgi:hypothetical protein